MSSGLPEVHSPAMATSCSSASSAGLNVRIVTGLYWKDRGAGQPLRENRVKRIGGFLQADYSELECQCLRPVNASRFSHCSTYRRYVQHWHPVTAMYSDCNARAMPVPGHCYNFTAANIPDSTVVILWY